MAKNNSSFEFYHDYEERVMKLQFEVYNEIKRIINDYLHTFVLKNNRKATVLEIGSGGLISFDHRLSAKITILELFPKPNKIILPENTEWIIGDILLDEDRGKKYDLILLSSVIHHLADKNNNIIKNLKLCFNNCMKLLDINGCLYIFDGTCPPLLTKLQDICYSLYTFLLLRIFKFTYVRILSLKEIYKCLQEGGFNPSYEFFKQPKYIGQMYWRVPLKFYPLRFSCVKAYLK